MATNASRNIANLLFLPVLVAGLSFTPSHGSFSSPVPAVHARALPVSLTAPSAVRSAPSAFEKEQAMSPKDLMARWAPFIEEASHRFGVSEEWIRAVMRMESGGRTFSDDGQPIISDAGAMGIMQIMPDTYEEMRRQYGLGADPYDPHDNVLAGAAYLSWLHGKYGYPKMFAAYNAGPGTVEARFAALRELPSETRSYVSGIAHILGTEFPSLQPAKMVAVAEVPKGPAMLTRPDGSSISVEGAAVNSIRAALPNEYAPGVQTVLAMGNLQQGVREDPETVASILRSHGANV